MVELIDDAATAAEVCLLRWNASLLNNVISIVCQ